MSICLLIPTLGKHLSLVNRELCFMCTSNAIHEDQSLGTPECIQDRTIRNLELNPKTTTWIFLVAISNYAPIMCSYKY